MEVRRAPRCLQVRDAAAGLLLHPPLLRWLSTARRHLAVKFRFALICAEKQGGGSLASAPRLHR